MSRSKKETPPAKQEHRFSERARLETERATDEWWSVHQTMTLKSFLRAELPDGYIGEAKDPRLVIGELVREADLAGYAMAKVLEFLEAPRDSEQEQRSAERYHSEPVRRAFWTRVLEQYVQFLPEKANSATFFFKPAIDWYEGLD